jgi:hypothetical protein
MSDEALSVIRYTIEHQIGEADKNKPWIWLGRLRIHYTGAIESSLLIDRLKFWNTSQSRDESVQDWKVKVRQTGTLCAYGQLSGELWDKFIFGLHKDSMRKELLKTHRKADKSPKTLQDVVTEAKALESAKKSNKLMVDFIEEEVNWTSHKQMKLKRVPCTCHWCGDERGAHSWKSCPAKGETCLKCGSNDHFANQRGTNRSTTY